MRRSKRSWRHSAIVVVLAATTLVLGVIPPALAAFSAHSENGGNIVTAATDFRAPQVTAVAIAKSIGGASGFVKQGGGYFVYANVTADTGKPASGLATVSADVHTVTTGSTAISLSAGSFSAGGVSFNYRSAALSADAILGAGSKAFTVTVTDNALNAASLEGTVTVDNAAPAAGDIQTTNAGTNGLAEQGDSIVLSFSEPIEPESVLTGWTGTATPVVVRLIDNGLLGLPLGNDAVQIFNAANSTALPLGTIELGRGDYVAGLLGGNVRFGATGTTSTMTMSGNTISIVLGTYNATAVVDPARTTAGGTGTMTWTPVATPFDRAANPMSTATAA
ncbi:MAG TPA: hypothetical protein VJQ84_09330, partial [Solirubrobacterales bacterium]|nr:hypothetical protein [Solirubrobacterales bacterium]